MNNKKGISMIVLAITIIVMIVLASAIILSLRSSGIIDKANEAKSKTDIANAKQVVAMAEAEWKLDEEKIRNEGYDSFKEYAEDNLEKAGFKINGKDSYEVTEEGIVYAYPVIPEGFVVSEIDGESKVSEGLVIYELNEAETKINDSDWKANLSGDANILDIQEERNQFVWIPVNDISTFVLKEGFGNGKLQTLVSSGKISEPVTISTGLSASNDLTGEFAEYSEMRQSVEKYGGFYIGRYEVGTNVKREDPKTTENGTTDVYVRRNKLVYNYVGWGVTIMDTDSEIGSQGEGAVKLARNMYKNSSSVVSTLCYGIQWDAIMNFLEDVKNKEAVDKKFVEDSSGMGVYGVDEIEVTGSNEEYNAKNIYDIAGNAIEWTMETYMSGYRVVRGGAFSSTGSNSPASFRLFCLPNNIVRINGFRPALYLK